MANTTDFISAVHDEIVRVLDLGDADGSNLVQMAWPGISLGPADFHSADDPQGPVDPEVAGEAVAALANVVPAFSRARFENSGFDVDEVYEILLASAVPSGATRDTVATDPLHHRFSAAQQVLAQARRARHDDPNGFYHPCTASPGDWYDEAATAGWTTVRLGQADMKPASASNSPFMTSGGHELARSAAWRLKPVVADNAALRHKLRGAAATAPVASTTTDRDEQGFAPAAAPTSGIGRGGLDIAGVDLLRPNLGIPNLARRLAVKHMVDRQTPALPSSPGTDGFSISFRMCRVTLERPWLALDLLDARNWWMSATPSGTYSTGTTNINPGIFPLLTTSFVAIRDLKFSANWAADDRKHLGNASSFGFFDLRSGVVKHGTVEVKGLQIIAWLSRVMPRLPPLSPP